MDRWIDGSIVYLAWKFSTSYKLPATSYKRNKFLKRLTLNNVILQEIFKFRSTQIIILSFVAMILIGTVLLMLPISTTDGQGLHPIDALFTSTSASCVCGLTVVDLHNDLTIFGTIVMLFLIQIGGLGIMTLATLVFHTMGYKFQMKESLVLQESLNQGGQAGIFDLLKRIIIYTFANEGFFALLLEVHFYSEF